jgi:hypothetical protein
VGRVKQLWTNMARFNAFPNLERLEMAKRRTRRSSGLLSSLIVATIDGMVGATPATETVRL